MSNNKAELLIDHLDNKLTGSTWSPEVEQLIRDDGETAEEWHRLNTAVDAVRDAAMHEQVMAIRKEWMSQQTAAAAGASKARVFTMYRNVMRIAACVLVMAGGAAVYKYTTTSATGLYREYYSSYELTTNRGAAVTDPIEQAYNDKNWAGVLSLYNATKDNSSKSCFLAGMANLELKNYDVAAMQFKQVIVENLRSGSDYFQDEAEYYLAMSWLATDHADQALPILERIKADAHHLYHQKVLAMSSADLHIASFKDHK